ncbi:MAG: carbohydrate ABC transporter permease [Butyrivibrio sp.]|uniref:carbohydrate ABC transporter permease n=1 Tax=Butyrivibrio sp. TaxID=28121 RepID=UPI001B0A8402|nr:carbohydrate ABC transporter permease [Butyrivibrio sp.]MBO6242754.1 carbohydrate ABC transporter permease [Butyrivibrio sp.]
MTTMKSASSTKVKESTGSKIFDLFNILLLFFIAFICLSPFLYVFSASVSNVADVNTRGFFIYPTSFDLSAYQFLIKSKMLIGSIGRSFLITIIGTALSLTVTVMMAYSLSKPDMWGRAFINKLIVFTMLFSGGMIPTYLVVSGLKLTDTYFALWLPGLVSAYNMILIRTNIMALPSELLEAAKVDGCNDFVIFYKIVLPLIKPSLATFGLFYAVGYWNDFFNATIYLNDMNMWPIQVWLRQIVLLSAGVSDVTETTNFIAPSTINYAVIIFATVPILCVYPFIMRFFEKGMMVGSVKG